MTPDPNPAVTQTITITGNFNATHHFNFFMNNSTFRANYNNPLLLLAREGNESYPYDPEWNVYNFGEAPSIRFVVINNFPAAHPMHMHGHNMFVLATGTGQWNGSIVNPQNPQRRDVQTLPAFGYIVVQIAADNPGVWPFHCHIAWHVSQGLYINIMVSIAGRFAQRGASGADTCSQERPNDIKQMQIPQVMAQTCTDWTAFSNHNNVDEIDSGL